MASSVDFLYLVKPSCSGPCLAAVWLCKHSCEISANQRCGRMPRCLCGISSTEAPMEAHALSHHSCIIIITIIIIG